MNFLSIAVKTLIPKNQDSMSLRLIKKFNFPRQANPLFSLVALITLISISGCDWPRDNPLDPKGINYGIADPAIPELPVLSISSYHSSQWFPTEDFYTLELSVSGYLTDLADSVVFVYNDTTCFQMNRESEIWRTSIESSVFPNNSLADLIGVPYIAVLYRDQDTLSITGTAYLFRIIDDVPETDQPSGNIGVIPTPRFSWKPVYTNFSFTYTISVINISTSGFVTEVENISGIPPDLLAYTLTDSLPSGSYYWTVAIADTFGNTSRSREAAFWIN